MAGNLITLDVRTRKQWRQWLAKHHASSSGIWLVRYKQHSAVKAMPYEDVVREALCFGWVDSLIKRLDDDRYAIKVTPRKPTSKWSDINWRRWNDLKAGHPGMRGVDVAEVPSRPRVKTEMVESWLPSAACRSASSRFSRVAIWFGLRTSAGFLQHDSAEKTSKGSGLVAFDVEFGSPEERA
jgi:hypothetical protein